MSRPLGRALSAALNAAAVARLKPFDDSTPSGRSRERYRRIVLTSGGAVAAKMVSAAAALISVPLTVTYLGAERYGLWMMISSIIVLLGFADLGIGNGLLNAIAAAHGRDDSDAARRYVSSAFFMLAGIALVASVAFALTYSFVDWGRVFNLTSPLARQEAGPAVAVFVAFFCLNLPLDTVQRVQQGYQEGAVNHLWGIGGSVLGLVGLLVAVFAQAGLPWLVLAMAGGPTLAVLANWLFVFAHSHRWLSPRPRFFDQAAAKEVAGSGAFFLVLTISSLLVTYSDSLIIAHVISASAVAKYAVTQKLFLTAMVSHYFVTPLWPAFGEALARRDYDWARKTLTRAIRLSVGVGVLLALPLVLFGQFLISKWVGPALVPSVALLLGFGLFLILGSYGGAMSTFLNSGPLLRRQVRFYLPATVVAIVLKIGLAPRWGITGVAWATVIAFGLLYVGPAAKVAYGSFPRPASAA